MVPYLKDNLVSIITGISVKKVYIQKVDQQSSHLSFFYEKKDGAKVMEKFGTEMKLALDRPDLIHHK